MSQPYFILSLDGGGVRGALTITLLQRLEEARPGLLARVNLFAGTSTGSILATALAAGKTPAEILEAYRLMSSSIFRANWFRRIPYLGNVLFAKYANQALRAALETFFQDQTLADLQSKLLVAAFDLDGTATRYNNLRTWKAKFFNNLQEDDLSRKLVDVVSSSAAAPTYFPAYGRYIDGGVAANNPSMAALAQALDEETGKQKLEDVALLSLGTGLSPRYLEQRDMNWGWAPWFRNYLISIILEGSVDVADYQVQRLLGREHYCRLQPILPHPIDLDNVGALQELEDIGRAFDLAPALAWVDRNFQ